MRVTVLMGGANAPVSAASGAIAESGRRSGSAKSIKPSRIGCAVPRTISTPRGPRRSTIRPMIGAAQAIATMYAPTATPAKAKEPDSARRCISNASDIIPIGMRATRTTASSRTTSGKRKNAA